MQLKILSTNCLASNIIHFSNKKHTFYGNLHFVNLLCNAEKYTGCPATRRGDSTYKKGALKRKNKILSPKPSFSKIHQVYLNLANSVLDRCE